jgi:tetratricopeptide (TPR) repeat protein
MQNRFASALLLLLIATPAAFGSGSSPATPSTPNISSPGDQAISAYNDGLRYRDRAWKAEKELATAQDPARRTKLGEIIKKSYEADVRSQKQAIGSNPNMFQAHSELGYALRKTGDYAGALASYDQALNLQPNYGEAIEYRAEAYLGLNRIDDAKNAYLLLYNGGAKELAKQLGGAMQKWVDERKADPAGLTTATIDDFSKWISQRSEISGTTGSGSWR